ncbi:hypothetical protein J1614_009969 [Plenodomus biglobosus]|nr:hypothetical protein J1614_009969 [Plenodomus biglobosus]
MDPRSVEASITAVLQLSAKVLGYLNDVEDTSKDHAKCAVETSNVHCLLLELRARLQGILLVEQHPYALWYTALRALGVENGPLDQFKQALEALQTIITDGDGLKQASKALMWRFKKEEVVGILQRIESFKKLVEIALKMNHFKLSQAIKDDTNFVQTHVPAIQSRVNKIRQDEADLKHGKMLDWISPTHYPAQQSVIMGHRQKGTSQWFLDAPEFARWLGEPRGTLFCPGIPGAGKTMVAAIAIDHLLESAQNSSVGVAYVYCNYKAQQEQDASSMLAAIVKQLVQSRPSAEEPVARLHSQHADRGTKPSLEEIFCTLREVVATYTTVYVVIDALDECRDGDGTRSQLLARLRDLQMGQDVRIMATARFMPEIEAEFQTAMRLEIQASDEDVRRFVAGQTHRLPKCIQRDPALQKMVEERTLERIDGMFLLARSRIDSLLDKQTPQRVKATLANFSKASTTLDHVNEMNLQRIMFESGRRGELARKVLSWIVLARRPITTAEICCALAVEPNEADLDPDNLPEIDDLVSVCVGMVKVDNGSGFIHLTHYTTQDYLERTQDMWFPDSETFITTICTAYLSFGVFKTGNCRSDEEFAERLHSYCLYDYAARYWGYHARNASTLSQVVMDFLQDKAKVEASSQAMLVDHASSSSNYSQQVPSQITGLHLSAYFGLDKAVVNLLNSGHQPNCKDSNGQTPLWWSAKKDHEAVTEVLCKKDTITLYLLIQEGENDLVKALLKAGYNVNSADFRRRTPLHNAVTSESVELATDLISAGADVNAKDMNEATPLRLAVKSKKLNMIKMLLEKSANTMDITTTEWRRTFESHTSDILKLTQKAGGGISLQLVPEELQSEVIQFAAKPRTERYLL